MLGKLTKAVMAISLIAICAQPAFAADERQDDGIAFKPIIDARLRYEAVDQPVTDADALTLRLRGGVQASHGSFSFLAEAEGTLALSDDYNAFPFPIDDPQRRTEFSVVADPENLELNRLQIAYSKDGNAVTLGRQRINLDDQRWVGSVGWRQNEQTFNAVRGEAAIGPVNLDLTYAIDQRTIFGEEAGPRTALSGDFVFASAGAKLDAFDAKAFAYLLDYDETFFLANSSQTYGGLVNGKLPIGVASINLKASYARQTDYGDNPNDYAADYWNAEAGVSISDFGAKIGFEQLGSDNGTALQSPMATLHKFNGWADLFLTTPPGGLNDFYVGASMKLPALIEGFDAQVVYHQFDSAVGNIDYGNEWNASIGFKIGKVGLLAKYANYNAAAHAVDTEKIWLQAGISF